jgi:hypothetical protein
METTAIPGGAPTHGPLPSRRAWLGMAIAVVVAGAFVAAAVLFGVPGRPSGANSHEMSVVSDPGVVLLAGSPHAVYFPFQPTAVPPNGDGDGTGVTSATLTGSFAVVGCAAGQSCPGVVVLVLTNNQLEALRSGTSGPAVWCGATATAACGPSLSVHFSVPVGAYSAEPLNLVAYAPSGSPGVTLSASATLMWSS